MPLHNIMLIDDSEADQFLTSMIIEDFAPDAKLTVAFNGAEALDILSTADEMPQMILLDINMPIMNGFDFLDAMAQRHPDSPVMVSMMSSSNAEQDRLQAQAYDCVKLYLEKPISPEALASIQALFD